MKKILKPKEIADLLGIKVEELVSTNIDRLSADSLNKMLKNNPEKYQLQICGLICNKLNISVEELVLYSKQRGEIIEFLRNQEKSR